MSLTKSNELVGISPDGFEEDRVDLVRFEPMTGAVQNPD